MQTSTNAQFTSQASCNNAMTRLHTDVFRQASKPPSGRPSPQSRGITANASSSNSSTPRTGMVCWILSTGWQPLAFPSDRLENQYIEYRGQRRRLLDHLFVAFLTVLLVNAWAELGTWIPGKLLQADGSRQAGVDCFAFVHHCKLYLAGSRCTQACSHADQVCNVAQNGASA